MTRIGPWPYAILGVKGLFYKDIQNMNSFLSYSPKMALISLWSLFLIFGVSQECLASDSKGNGLDKKRPLHFRNKPLPKRPGPGKKEKQKRVLTVKDKVSHWNNNATQQNTPKRTQSSNDVTLQNLRKNKGSLRRNRSLVANVISPKPQILAAKV